MSAPVKVLYIAGAGRTGSTLVEKLLGQLDGVFAGGELTFLWGYALRGRCSCGLALRDCAVWQAIFDEAFGGFDAVDADEMVALRARSDSRTLPLLASKRARQRLLERLGPFPELIDRVYQAIRSTTGSRVIVDSSKEPHYSWILDSRPDLDVRVLHLVRDPRAVAHSWAKRNEQKGIPGTWMEQRSAATSSAYFAVSNVAAEALWRRSGRYLRLRYEDVMADPIGAGAQIGELLDEPIDLAQVLPDGRSGVVHETHSAWGNPNRFDTGPVQLRLDDAWRAGSPTGRRLAVTVLNGPLMLHYGYPLGTATHGAPPG